MGFEQLRVTIMKFGIFLHILINFFFSLLYIYYTLMILHSHFTFTTRYFIYFLLFVSCFVLHFVFRFFRFRSYLLTFFKSPSRSSSRLACSRLFLCFSSSIRTMLSNDSSRLANSLFSDSAKSSVSSNCLK